VDGPGVMTIIQYRRWMATWKSVRGRTTNPQFPINRVRYITTTIQSSQNNTNRTQYVYR
jgi:hypothetical protein